MRGWHYSTFYFFYFTTIGVIIPYWSLHLQYIGFNATEIGQLMAILLATKVVAPNIWASVVDHLIAKHGSALGLLKFAVFATLIFYSLLYWVSSYWWVAFLMLGYCVFWNACLPQIESATLNYLKERRDEYGAIRLWGSIGFIVTVSLLGVLMDISGPKVIFPAGIISLVLLFIVSVFMRDTSLKPPPKLSNSSSIRKLLTPRVLLVLMLCVLMQVSHAPFYTFFSIFLESYGYSKSLIGVLWSLGVVFEIIVFMVCHKIMRNYPLIFLLSVTFLIAGIRWCLLGLYPESLTIVIFTQIMHAVTYGLYHSVMIQLIDRYFQGQYQVRGQALYSSITFGVGGALGSVISGYVWTYFGANFLFYAAGFMMLAVAAFSFVMLNDRHDVDSQVTH